MVYLELRIGQMGQDDSPDNVAKGGGMTHTPNFANPDRQHGRNATI